jgi:DNA invertase Pin-like site-specific DNA recombinase
VIWWLFYLKEIFMTKKVCLYCRTSTQNQSKGLEAQERALLSYCRANEIKDYVIFRDEGVSGTKSSRPELDRLMDLVRYGEVSSVFVYSFSRFARSTKHLVNVLEEFNQYDVDFVSISENIDTRSPLGRALYTIISAINAIEVDTLRQRTLLGLSNARAKGVQLGRPVTRNSKLIKSLRAKGYAYREIAELVGCSISTVHRELHSCSKKLKE